MIYILRVENYVQKNIIGMSYIISGAMVNGIIVTN